MNQNKHSTEASSVKHCNRCGKPEGEVHMGRGRGGCYSCLGKLRRGTLAPLNPLQGPPANEPPEQEQSPLETAYNHREARDERRTEKRQIDALIDENKQLKAEIDIITKASAAPEIIVYEKAAGSRSDATAVAMASDWHVEEPVNRDRVHGLNEFNLDIARARSEAFFRNTLRLTDIFARESKIDTLYLAVLGDMFSGYIHEEFMAENLLQPAEACIFFKGLFVSGIKFLLRESNYTIRGKMLPGNHGRMTKKMWTNPVGTSLEVVAYQNIIDIFENEPRVQLERAKQAMVYERFYEDFNVRMIHGYEIKYNGGVGGLTIPLNKAVSRYDRAVPADLTLLGHYHQRFDGGNFMVNGSLIGFNEYAQEHGFSPEPAQQQFFLIDARNGGEKSIVAPVWLDKKSA